ncbi:MAG: 23S rRNA (adenine(2030)-N(6))-methyltransferase RlmJ [Rhodanobacter sp.]|jgi:23S rRNA (adenine2030-N6)-methyltransferase|nr:23S rRNA (adenine(2030)-N(6))-methyltransferase RlmJ [Rhodanobacter sp.]
MNYRHAFHAGNFADVFKHVLLIGLLEALKAKPAAFCYVDTHAGRGCYDLRGEEAERTREYVDGVQRLMQAAHLPAPLDRYVELVRDFAEAADTVALSRYPGSPLIARLLLREQDRGMLCELHEEEAAALRTAMRGDARFAIHRRDGYAALKALLPPAQKRGLVLIDPPFEAQGAVFAHIRTALDDALSRWPNAIYAVWYPIKRREPIAPFLRWVANHTNVGDALVAELLLHPDNSVLRLNGCGMAIINPPWRLDQQIKDWLPTTQRLLAQGGNGSSRIEWLKQT